MEENNNTTPELKLEEVTTLAPEVLTPEQKIFIEKNKDNLTEEQSQKYGFKKEEELDINKIEPETRYKQEEKSKEKEEEEFDPEDKDKIEKIVDRKVGSKLFEMENKMEVSSFVASKPEYGKYKDVILKYMVHPDYKNIPVYNIAAIVASKDLMKLGAQKEREAMQKAKDTQGGGSTVRKEGTVTDWHNATKEDFENQKSKVLGQVK